MHIKAIKCSILHFSGKPIAIVYELLTESNKVAFDPSWVQEVQNILVCAVCADMRSYSLHDLPANKDACNQFAGMMMPNENSDT